MLSKTFKSLLESMKSYDEIDEDKDERKRKGEERRKERREEKFGVSTDNKSGVTAENQDDKDFKIRPFIRAVEQLKSQVQSEIFNIKQTLDNREPGYQSAKTYDSKFGTILEIITRITSKMDVLKDKEGRNLESDNAADIKIFRGLYSTATNDFLAAKKEWSEKKVEADIKYLSDLKDTDTNNLIFKANKVFGEAEAMLAELIRNSVTANTTTTTTTTTTNDITLKDTIVAGKRYTNDSNEGKIVILVKKAIYLKFKKFASLTELPEWPIVYKNYPNVSGSFLDQTTWIIRKVKEGLATKEAPDLAKDKTGNITPAFIAAINKMAEGKENTYGRLISFSDFIKNKVLEQFDEDAVRALKKEKTTTTNNSGSGNSKKPNVKVPEYSATPFKNDTEGNTFRAWVIKTYPDWAATNHLSETGPKDNTYIRKAYSEFGAAYAKSKEAPAEVKTVARLTNSQLQQIVKSIKASGASAEIKIITSDNSPYVFWWRGKEYGNIYNNFRLQFVSSSGKKFAGTYATGGNIKFDNGKTITLKDFVAGNASFKISGEKPEVAQSKKAFVSSSGEGFTNVRSSAMANTGSVNNLLYKHTNKTSQIGVVVSSQVVKSTKIGDKTWYKVQFPTKMSGKEFGYVRSDTVDLK